MTAPETLLTHRSTLALSFERNRLTLPLRRSHHSADPENTPATSTTAEKYRPLYE
jgi:hypothetical protein